MLTQIGIIGDFVFRTKSKRAIGVATRAFSFQHPRKVFDFAKTALKQFEFNCAGAIVDGGLSRIDIMCMEGDQFVVNEFESLEACIPSRHIHNARAEYMLRMYWLNKLKTILLETPPN